MFNGSQHCDSFLESVSFSDFFNHKPFRAIATYNELYIRVPVAYHWNDTCHQVNTLAVHQPTDHNDSNFV